MNQSERRVLCNDLRTSTATRLQRSQDKDAVGQWRLDPVGLERKLQHELDDGLPTKPGRVGSCITIFGACSAFTHVTAYTLAESP